MLWYKKAASNREQTRHQVVYYLGFGENNRTGRITKIIHIFKLWEEEKRTLAAFVGLCKFLIWRDFCFLFFFNEDKANFNCVCPTSQKKRAKTDGYGCIHNIIFSLEVIILNRESRINTVFGSNSRKLGRCMLYCSYGFECHYNHKRLLNWMSS